MTQRNQYGKFDNRLKKATIVDDDDFCFLSKHKWFVTVSGYVTRSEKLKTIYMHRVVAKNNTNKKALANHLGGGDKK